MTNRTALGIAAASVAVISAMGAVPARPVLAAAPVVSLSSSSLNFGSAAWLQPAATQTVVLTNTGDAPLVVSPVDITGQPYVPEDFLTSLDQCQFRTISPGGQCQITVNFKPQSGGPRTATLLIYDNAAGSPHQVTLSGTGTGAVIGFSPQLLEFGVVPVGTTSGALPFTVINSGDGPVTISSAAIDPIYAHSGFAIAQNGCASTTLGPGQRCSISVSVSPPAVGETFAQVNLFDNAGTGEQKYLSNFTALDATGGGAQLTIPNFYQSSFNQQGVGTASAATQFQVFNSGTQLLSITSAGLDNSSAGFAITSNTCNGATLAPATPVTRATCAVDVVFAPTAVGSFSAGLVFHDNELSGTHSLLLTGTGYAPVAVLSTSAIDFGLQADGTMSAPQTVTLSNPSSQPLTVTSAALSGSGAPYFQVTSNGCNGVTLAPGGACSVSISFAPPFPFPFAATLSFSDAAAGSPHTVSMTGEGLGTAFAISTSHLSFGNLHANAASAPQTVTVTNTLTTAMSYGHLMGNGTVTGCTAPINPGATCVLSVSIFPTSVGPQSARLSIFDSALPANVQFVQVDFNGVSGSGFLTDGLINDQLVQRTGTSALVTAVLRNVGSDVLNVGRAFLTGTPPAAITADSCSNQAIAVAGVCTILVTASPSIAGGWFTALTVPSDAAVGPNPAVRPISGWAAAPTQPVFSPASVTFPGQTLGGPESTQIVWLINGLVPGLGAQVTTISSVTLGGPNTSSFRIVWDGCTGLPVSPAYSCPVSIGFDPAAGGTLSASVTFNDDAVGSPQVLSLSGVGLGAVGSVSPSSLDFGSVIVAAKSAPQTVTLTNSGNRGFTISREIIGGPYKGDYSMTSENCRNQTLAPGTSCQVTIVFRPEALGSRPATLTFTDDALNAPQSVPLLGSGMAR
jgi:hypothetical protein